MRKTPKDPNQYPKGWNRRKVKAIADYYYKQSDSEAIAEAEAAYHKRTTALIEVPIRLLPKVRRLIARSA
jgi:hypothetical protein